MHINAQIIIYDLLQLFSNEDWQEYHLNVTIILFYKESSIQRSN